LRPLIEVEVTEVADLERYDLAVLLRDCLIAGNALPIPDTLNRLAEVGGNVRLSQVRNAHRSPALAMAAARKAVLAEGLALTVPAKLRNGPAPDEGFMTREQRRSKRKRAIRAKTTSVKRMTKREIELGRLLFPEGEYERPTTRSQCAGGQRPCPFVSCHHHLYLDINPKTGAIKFNFPDLEPDQMGESCALDVADRGGATLEKTGEIMNLTRERIRQLEVNAMGQIMASEKSGVLLDFVDPGDSGRRRLRVVQSGNLLGRSGRGCQLAEDSDEDELDEEDPLDSYDDESRFEQEPFNFADDCEAVLWPPVDSKSRCSRSLPSRRQDGARGPTASCFTACMGWASRPSPRVHLRRFSFRQKMASRVSTWPLSRRLHLGLR
jgi:hypothetical protein